MGLAGIVRAVGLAGIVAVAWFAGGSGFAAEPVAGQAVAPPGAAAAKTVSGDAVIRGKTPRGEIVLTTTSRLAGAVHSLTWDGQEFVDSFDHGRQIQSALNADCGGKLVPETFNPTEAGSSADHKGPHSTSELLRLTAAGNRLESTCRMAFWLAPHEKSFGNPARNRTKLSEHLLSKRIEIGRPDLPQGIAHDVTFVVPPGEGHTLIQFESLTGYMPPKFSVFRSWNATAGRAEPLTDGPGEQPHPVIFATEDDRHALAVLALPGVRGPRGEGGPSAVGPGYGRFRFEREKVVKWNVVYRVRDAAGVPPGEYFFPHLMVIGTLQEVVASLKTLAPPPPRK